MVSGDRKYRHQFCGFSDGSISRIDKITTPGGTEADICLPQEESTINNCFYPSQLNFSDR